MATIVQQFFPSAVVIDQTFSGANVIRKLVETAPAANSTTTCTWTATGAQIRTVIPLTGSTAATDTTQNNGWAHNNGGADGLESTATAKRIVPAGTWTSTVAVTLNAPALLATIAATMSAKVYRVATGGGARTLLFTFNTSANFSASGTVNLTSPAQPLIVLEDGEVLEIGYTATSQATAATVLGAITNTVLTIVLGSGTSVTVPTPGIRTRYPRSLAAAIVLVAVITRKLVILGAKTATLTLVGDFTRSIVAFRSFTTALTLVSPTALKRVSLVPKIAALSLAATFSRALALNRAFTTALTLTATKGVVRVSKFFTTGLSLVATFTRRIVASRSFTTALTLGTVFARFVTAVRSFTTALSITGAFSRALNLNRAFTTALTLTGVKGVIRVSKFFTAGLSLVANFTRRLQAFRSFTTALTLATNFARFVTAVRSFTTSLNLVANGRVDMAFVVLNRIVGGGGSIIKKILYIFDD